MKRNIIATLTVALTLAYLPFAANAQSAVLKGRVFSINSSGEKAPLPFANLHWLETNKAVQANAEGYFEIENYTEKNGEHRLIASFTGLSSDTLLITKGAKEVIFELQEGGMLEGVTVKVRQKGSFISSIEPLKTEVITVEGLCKMACCNLAESFENTATISVGFSDAVSGARQIRMLGLAGTYTQMLDENVPTATGMAATYGLSYTPGPWLESIQISKGTASVINGYESIAGQINMEHRKPDRSAPLYVNLFASSEERYEANVIASTRFNDRLSSILLVHGSADTRLHDRNGDGFADFPRVKQGNFSNRWLYKAKNGFQYRFGLGFLDEKREGGQIHSHTTPLYQINIENQHLSTYAKMGIPFDGEQTSLGIIGSYHYHDGSTIYGDQSVGGRQKSFIGNESTLFLNLIFQSAFGSNNQHLYSVGGTFRYNKLNAMYTDDLRIFTGNQKVDFGLEEAVSGAFAEYTYSPSDKLSLIGGVRGDYNNLFGTLFTPRAHLKYTVLENTTIRASAGRGYRTPNLIADNLGILANSRTLFVDVKDLTIEEAWTYGASVTQTFPLSGNKSASISVDAFRSNFNKQVIVDVERDASGIYAYNLDGKSYANTYQIDFSIEPVERFNIFATFRYTENKQTMSHGLVKKPLVDRYKGLINLAYATKFEKWKIDVTAQLNGKSRIPTLDGNMANSSYSPNFPMFYAQLTKKFRRLDVYVGCENIFNYMQPDPIIDAENPFGSRFDASLVWGPLMGRVVYGGIRLTLGNAE